MSANEPQVVYAVLAAGTSERMGFAKTVAPLGGRSPLARLGTTLAGRTVTVVASAATAEAAARAVPGARVLVNPEPARGMTSSLAIANAAAPPIAYLGVLLADKPFVQAATLAACEGALAREPCDVLVATADGNPGHPVYFSPAARARIAGLPDGDTLRALRDDPALVRRSLSCEDAGVIEDLDTPEAWHAAERRERTGA